MCRSERCWRENTARAGGQGVSYMVHWECIYLGGRRCAHIAHSHESESNGSARLDERVEPCVRLRRDHARTLTTWCRVTTPGQLSEAEVRRQFHTCGAVRCGGSPGGPDRG